MSIAQFAELLGGLNSSDNAVRKKAETMYQQAKKGQPDQLMIGMISVLGASEVDAAVRAHCAVLLRQFTDMSHDRDFVWSRVNPQNQQQVSAELLRLFEVELSPQLQKKIGEIISKLAEYVCDKDDPRGSLAPGNPSGWPALLPLAFRMANASAATSVDRCTAAIRLLTSVVPTLKADIVALQQELGQTIQLALAHSDMKLRSAVLLFVCAIVGEVEKPHWAPLVQALGPLVQLMQQMAQQNKEDMLQEAMQAMIEVASAQPEFFKTSLLQSSEPATFIAGLAKCRDVADNGLRNLALEWLVTYVEKRAKWLTKSLPTFIPLVLEVCMSFMLEIEDGEAELNNWVTRMDDEEGGEDEELFSAGHQAIDRIAAAIQMEVLGPQLFPLLGRFAAQGPWQAKHAVLAGIKQTVEYLEEMSHINEMAKLLLQHVDHQHPRVRYTALHAIGQMAHDQAPQFQEAWHATLMPVLMKKMDDPVDRVAAMAMSAFVSFGEPLDTTLMATYAQSFMEKVVAKLQSTQHRGVREESITCIAVIAGVIGTDFSLYYDGIMPMLKKFVMNATGEKENRLRGKSFECMSLLGLAVGKEKFLPDAREAIQSMMTTSTQADDIQREYIEQASDRIAKCLKKDFAPFLPAVLPGLVKSLTLDGDSAAGSPDESEYYQIFKGDGQVVQVHSDKFNQLMQALRLLNTYCGETEGAFYDYVAPTAQAMLPLLSTANEMETSYEDVRGASLWTWSLLIKAARAGSTERGLPPSLPGDLLRTGLAHTFKTIAENFDPEVLASTASGLTECIKNVGPGILNAAEILQLVQRIFAMLDQSFQRSAKADAIRQKSKSASGASGGPVFLVQPGEEEEDDAEEHGWEENACRQAYVEVLGALMKVGPAEFLQCVPACGERIQQWIGTTDHKVLALYLACALIEHLKEHSESVWPAFMSHVFQALGDTNAEARTAAAYAINLAAPIPGFAQASPQAFRILSQIVSGTRPKKRNDKAKTAYDNAVGALMSLAIGASAQCPPEVQAWTLILSRLPLRHDEDEAKIVHEKIVDQVMAQNQGLLGSGNANIGLVLSILAEVYHTENICNKSTDEKILKVFKMIPQPMLLPLVSGFTEKQQKKVHKLLSG